MSKRRKTRVSFHKNLNKKPRVGDVTRQFREDRDDGPIDSVGERVRAKGDLSRKRTVWMDDESNAPSVPLEGTRLGRVLAVHGLYCIVVTEAGEQFRCYTRRVLKSLRIDERGAIATGDFVRFKPAPDHEGLIVRVEPRRSVMVRGSRHREHVIAANIQQVLLVASLVDPVLKPNLLDRYLLAAEKESLRPILALNKVDRVDPIVLQPLMGAYAQLGYAVLLTSATTGRGIDQLRDQLIGRETVIVGQSGVGKSSLLNALNPELDLKVGSVSSWTRKGRHTTTTARLLRLAPSGVVIDTPGVRQFELWAATPDEIRAGFIEFGPYAPSCRFPGCTHTHEIGCAVRDAVEAGEISRGRLESYERLLAVDGRPPTGEDDE